MRALVCLLAASLPAPASAEVMTGPVTVSDGDTLSMTGTRIRLFGIDAPESAQTCQRCGAAWECGKEAAARLAAFVDGKQIACARRDTDGYGRMVAVCRAGGLDLGEVMVSAGLAVALPKFSEAYVEADARARRARLGLWGSVFEMPAVYRAAHPQTRPVVRRRLQGRGRLRWARPNRGAMRQAARSKAIATAKGSGSITCRACPTMTERAPRSCSAARNRLLPQATGGR